jgi:two-component system, OmpR family, sensor histidine kinase BaeS
VGLDRAVPEAPLWVAGDVTLLEQALSNAIHNAVRYNREGGHVAVVLESLPGQRFALRVTDDGPGIPEAERARLLERYFRGNAARSRDPEGRGLGLSIAFRVAQLHGWQLSLSQAAGGGLQVDLEGPLGAAPDPRFREP